MNSVTFETGAATPAENGTEMTLPSQAGDDLPPFGWTVLRGMWFGILGGIACHWMAVIVLTLVAAIAQANPIVSIRVWGPTLWSEFAMFGGIGSAVAAIIGLLIGGFSVMLMWMVLYLLPNRSVRTRRVVGAVCAFVVVAALVRGWGLPLLANSPLTSLETYSNPWVWIFLLDVAIVTIVGAWFSEKYLNKNFTQGR